MPADTLTPPATNTPDAPKGIDAMMAQLDAAAASGGVVPPAKPDAAAPPAAPDAPAAPDPAAAPDAGKKTDGVHDPLKPAAQPGKPAAAEGEMSVEDMEKFLKAHSNKKPWKVYESLKTTTAQKVAELETKLAAFANKPVESPGDAAKMAALEKQIEALSGETKTYKQKLAATDYIHTPKYTELQTKANRIWSKAAQAVEGMQFTDDEGNSRQATKEDFDFIRLLPHAKRRTAAKAAFGDDAIEVLGFVNQIEAVREENAEAQEAFVKGYEQTTLQRELESKGQQAKFDSTLKASLDKLRKNETWGKWFSPNEADPEATKLLNDGFSEIEKVLSLSDQMSVEDAAAHAAVFRARAAAMPRMILEYNRLAAKNSALEAELAKFRATDPGAGGATGGAGGNAGGDNRPRGIEGAALAFDSDPSLRR